MAKKSQARTWFLVHSWLALPVWFFLLIICVTGTLATVSQEIIWLANPDVRANKPADDAQRLTHEQVIQAIEQKAPEVIVRSIGRPDEGHFALNVQTTYPDGSSPTLYVNPYTGDIQGVSPQFDFRQFTRALHGWWLVPFTNGFSWGWYLVSFMGLPMLVSLITGLVVYKRFWKGFLKPRLRFNQGKRIFWGDFHRLSGIWSIWFIAIMSVTGTWFLVQAVLFDNHISISTEGVPPVIPRDVVPLAASADAVPRIDLDQAVAIASERVPGLDVSSVRLPAYAYGHISISGRGNYPLMFQSVEVNPYNGEIDSVRLLSDRSALEFVTESMRPLHTGDFGGLWVKMIWFVFGLMLSMMVLSGLLIWSKRTAKATSALLSKRKPAESRHTSLEHNPVNQS
jgi:uncharacterized iron-regulated membrane protein|tara:strand:- start:64460 stop:65650 length:1191 start_codon:yes stop_codon:yes gene_type:complete